MLAHTLAQRIDSAQWGELPTLTTQIWVAYGKELLTDDEAQALSDRIEARKGRKTVTPTAAPVRRASIFPPRKVQKPRDPSAVVLRRRLNSRHTMSPTMSQGYTNGELAVLKIVADEVAKRGFCDRSIDEIAARAGACRRLVQTTMKLAERNGLLKVQRRPRIKNTNLTNVITIISDEWLLWIKRGNKNQTGCKSVHTMDNQKSNLLTKRQYRPFERTCVEGRSTNGGMKGYGKMRC